MNTGDFAPYGKFNPNTGPSAGGGMAPQQQQGQQGGMQQNPNQDPSSSIQSAVPQPGTPEWVDHLPPGLMEMFQLAPTVGGLGPAFLQKYGHKFENVEGAEKLAGVLGQPQGFGGGMPQPVNYDEMDDDDLLEEDPWLTEVETGALMQSLDHMGLGGLNI